VRYNSLFISLPLSTKNSHVLHIWEVNDDGQVLNFFFECWRSLTYLFGILLTLINRLQNDSKFGLARFIRWDFRHPTDERLPQLEIYWSRTSSRWSVLFELNIKLVFNRRCLWRCCRCRLNYLFLLGRLESVYTFDHLAVCSPALCLGVGFLCTRLCTYISLYLCFSFSYRLCRGHLSLI